MKRRMQLTSLMLTVTGFAVLSCGQDATNGSKTNTELLTTGTWKLVAATVSPAYDYYNDGNAATDLFSILKPCERDDFEVYRTNGTWEYNEGPTKCDPTGPQVLNDSWSFIANEPKMFVGDIEHTILELTETSLKLRYSFTDTGVTYTEVDWYEHP